MQKHLHLLFAAVLTLSAPAAHADYAAGCTAYDQGDFAKAMREWKPAAEKGDTKSQFRLGCLFTHGQGVTVDHAEALKWYRQAAEQGDADAQNNLGGAYAEGLGVDTDPVTAFMWFTLAGRTGHEVAARNLEFSRRKMTAAQIIEGEQRARDWAARRPGK